MDSAGIHTNGPSQSVLSDVQRTEKLFVEYFAGMNWG